MKSHEETPGERAVKAELRYLKIKYRQEKKITGLTDDSKAYRVADFYLPEHDVYIEFAGNWKTGDEHKRRYREKMTVYAINDIKCIWIFPYQLHYASKVIKEGLEGFAAKPARTRRKRSSVINKSEQIQPETIIEIDDDEIDKADEYYENPTTNILGGRATKRKVWPWVILIIIFSLWAFSVIVDIDSTDDINSAGQENYVQKMHIPSPNEDGSRYYNLYEKLQIGMAANEVRRIMHNERFEWIPFIEETDHFAVKAFPPDTHVIKIYFDDIAQIEQDGAYFFTKAKLIRVELIQKGEIYKIKQ